MTMHAPVASAQERADHYPGHYTSPRRIGLVVDHPLRDLDGMCLVAQLLCERGHEAVLLPFYTQHLDLPNLDLDLIVLNYVRPANRALVRAAAARGIALAVLDTEGGLIPEGGPTSANGIATFLRQSGIDRQLALYMFWGEHLRDALVENTALPASRAIVTGCPRFDLAHTVASASQDQAPVLVNTNFPVVNSAHSDDYSIDAKALRSVGFSEREIAVLAENVRKVMQRMIDTVRTLAEARPNRQFIIRPHPFERSEPYETAFSDHANVRVERFGTAMEALAGCACLLHVNCTTAIEACLCGVPPIALDFVNEPALKAMARLPSEISHSANTLAEALALIDRAAKLEPGVAQHRIAPFFGPLDGSAATRVVDALAHKPLPRPYGVQAPPLRHRLTSVLGRTLGSGAIEGMRRKLNPARQSKGFGPADVRARIDRIALAYGQTAARVTPLRSRFGLPINALKVGAP